MPFTPPVRWYLAMLVFAILAAILGITAWRELAHECDAALIEIHEVHHVGPDARECGCALGVEEMRAEILEARDMVGQRLDMIDDRCVWLGPHKVPVLRVGR